MARPGERQNANETQRVPPQNEDAEEAVLGAMLISQRAVEGVPEIVSGSDFYKPSHGVIFDTIVALDNAGERIDTLTVSDRLEKDGKIGEVGGKVRIAELAALSTSTTNAAHHARIVREMATLRGLIRVGLEIADLGWGRPGETKDLVDRAEQIVFSLARGHSAGDEIEYLEASLHETVQLMSERAASKGHIVGVATGYQSIDRLTSGLQRGNLVIIAARPSIGKSALCTGIAANIAVKARLPVGLFTLEMSRSEITQRLLSAEAHVESQKIRTGQMAADEWTRVMDASATLAGAPIAIDDDGALTMAALRARARRLKRKHPDLAVIIVDYLQLMTSGSNFESRVQEVSQISRGMKSLARELDVPIVALSQLSRNVEQRHDKRPMLSDLRESGSIEQDADLVAFIYRDDYYHPEDTDQEGIAEIIFAKHRNGATDTVKLAFIKKYAKFSDLARPGDLVAGA